MNILRELKSRFRTVLEPWIDDPSAELEMIKPAQDAKFGDYQANCAMPLGKRMGKPPRDVAQQIVASLQIDDLCTPPEIAGPGFINLRLRDEWLVGRLRQLLQDERLGVDRAEPPRRYIVDYSAPNVAKPMHVGHIRSTVIGDSLCRILRFLGHDVIGDNHLGDWGTQFGMVIYGYRHFADADQYARQPVAELGRVYRVVRQLMDYHESVAALPQLQQRVAQLQSEQERLRDAPDGQQESKSDQKQRNKQLKRVESQIAETREREQELAAKIAAMQSDPATRQLCEAHPDIQDAVLAETAKLHAGDEANLQLWQEFLPKCRDEIDRIYQRLDIHFDVELGESFYHDRLPGVVETFLQKQLAEVSEGAICVFLDGFDAPMIIRKKDGAFLYATSDLATIDYRMQEWNPDAILYVVDFRQGEHFQKLFAAARRWGFEDVELRHIEFGTVLGPDGKPYKTRAGDTVGLEGLLDAAVAQAAKVVGENDDAKPNGPELDSEQRHRIAHIVGHAAIKYADLSQNRASDYVYSEEKMVALRGNTATYMQYSYARIMNIFARGEIEIADLRQQADSLQLEHEKERALGLQIARFPEALDEVLVDYRPNQLTSYLYALATSFSEFYESCPVLKADSAQQQTSRLLLCDLTARTLRLGLSLLGIGTVDKM